MKRALALFVALLASGGAGGLFAYLARRQVRFVTAAQLALQHDAEAQLALDAGLARIDQGTSSELPFTREVPLEAGQCVAVVASIDGASRFEEAEIALSGGRTARSSLYGRLVHLAACTPHAATASINLGHDSVRDALAPSQVRFDILRGVVTSPHSYFRLDVDQGERARFDEAAVLAREASMEGERIGAAIRLSRERATVLPPGAATFAGLRALTGRAGVVPAVDPLLAAADPFRRVEEVEIPPRALASDGLVRLLAVLDAGALSAAHGGRCLTVTLARLDDPSTPVPVRRIAIPSQTETVVATRDAAIAHETLCPAEGLFAYVTDESAGGEYLLAVRTSSDPTVFAVSASSFGAPPRRGPASVPTLPVRLVSRARADCEAGDATECLRWADLAAGGIEGAGEARAPLERACTLGSAEGCDRLATELEASGEPRLADQAERRACAAGAMTACLRRAARFRDGGRFLEAHSSYRFGCARGCAECCAARSTMEEWQLAPVGGPEPATPP